MANRKSDKDPTLSAWGKLMAEVPEVEAVVDYYRSLPPDTSEDERRALVVERIHEALVAIDQSEYGDGVLSPELLDASIWDGLRELVDALEEQMPPARVRDVLRWLSKVGGLDDLAYGWVKQTAEAGEAAPYFSQMHGGMFRVDVPGMALDGGALPVVLAIVTPSARIDDVVAQLRMTCADAFQDTYNPQPGTVAELATMMKYKKQGMTTGQIAWRLLSERYPEIRALPDDKERMRQYPDDYKKEMNRIRQMLFRLPG